MSQPNVNAQFPIQSLLSARLLLSPQLAEGKVYFLSDMSGVISLSNLSATSPRVDILITTLPHLYLNPVSK